MKLRLIRKEPVAAGVKRFTFAKEDGGALPAFNPGAHIELRFDGLTRRYSLTSSPVDLNSYEICVRRAEPSGGGSAYLHDRLDVGEVLDGDGPHNAFPLNTQAEHTIFIAGGIGVTPFLPMMDLLIRDNLSFELHYAARSTEHFLPVPAQPGVSEFYPDKDGRPSLNIEQLLADHPPSSDIYVCGPRVLIEVVRQTAARMGWPVSRIHFESFGPHVNPKDRPVRVILANSGSEILVEPGTTILDALLANGVWATYECRRGECVSCMTSVVSGEPDHRDLCLSEEQRRGAMCTCISWASSPTLTLDL